MPILSNDDIKPHVDTTEKLDATSRDRRRPGRATDVSQALVPLLRNPGAAGAKHDADDQTEERGDALSTAKGIAIGIALAIPIWALIAFGAWSFLRRG